jgi:hypothetical protein
MFVLMNNVNVCIILLQSCIKVALDFVSPEHIGECFRLTEECRKLPINHKSAEDKFEVSQTTFYLLDSTFPIYRGYTTLNFSSMFVCHVIISIVCYWEFMYCFFPNCCFFGIRWRKLSYMLCLTWLKNWRKQGKWLQTSFRPFGYGIYTYISLSYCSLCRQRHWSIISYVHTFL